MSIQCNWLINFCFVQNVVLSNFYHQFLLLLLKPKRKIRHFSPSAQQIIKIKLIFSLHRTDFYSIYRLFIYRIKCHNLHFPVLFNISTIKCCHLTSLYVFILIKNIHFNFMVLFLLIISKNFFSIPYLLLKYSIYVLPLISFRRRDWFLSLKIWIRNFF